MKKTSTLTAIVFMALIHGVKAQFTQLEWASGNKKTDFTAISFRPVTPNGSFSIATLAFFQKFHQEENYIFDETGVQSTLYWNINKTISLGPGLYYNSVAGFSQRLSTSYAIRWPNFILTAIPTIAHAENTGAINGELFLQIQITRPLKNNWQLLFSAQMLTNWAEFSDHTRSFQQIRAAFTKQDTQFGLAMDHDLYGDSPTTRTSWGVFFRKIFLNHK